MAIVPPVFEKHCMSAIVDALMVDRNMVLCPLGCSSFQWTKHTGFPTTYSQCPGPSNNLSPPLLEPSLGQSID